KLIEVRDGELAAAAHRPCVWFHLTQHELEQRSLAGPVGPDQPELVAALDDARKIFDHVPAAIALVDVPEFPHELARALACGEIEVHVAEPIAARSALAP